MMMPWFKQSVLKQITSLSGLAVLVITLMGGCQQNVVYQRSLSELNAKAQAMLQSGDVNGAVSRLEAAHDLQPQEPNTTYNLAIAYQTQGSYDKAIPLLESLIQQGALDKPELHKTLAITHEAKADSLYGQLQTQSNPEKPEQKNASDSANLQAEAIAHYQKAVENYQLALPGVKDAPRIQKQIEALQGKIEKLSGNTSSQPTSN